MKKKTTKTPENKARPVAGKKKNLREKINVLALIEALERHVLGETEMTPTQVSAALALLKKTLPDAAAKPAKTAAEKEKPSSAHEDALKELE